MVKGRFQKGHKGYWLGKKGENHPLYGRKLSSEHKEIAIKNLRTNYWIGKKHPQTEESKEKLRQWIGSKRYNWKGEKAGYFTKHNWIRRNFGKANKCENKNCKYKNPKRFEWANKSGRYKRDKKDWIQLCPSCHRKYDMQKIYPFLRSERISTSSVEN